MSNIKRIEPTDLTDGLWLAGNEMASKDVQDDNGVLKVAAGEDDGWRVSPGMDAGAITDVGSSKIEWVGDGSVSAMVGPSKYVGSTDLDGVDDKADPGKILIPQSTDFTIACKVKHPKTGNANQGIVSQWSSGQATRFVFGLRMDSVIEPGPAGTAFISIGGGDVVWTDQVPENDFFSLILTRQGNTFSLYLDNVLGANASADSSLGVLQTNLEIGQFGGVSASHYLGYLSGIALWNRAITSGERDAVESGNYPTGDLIAWLPLDEPPGQRTTLRDLSGNNNHATPTGTSYDPDNPHLQAATSGAAIPGVSQGDNLTGKYVHVRQDLTGAQEFSSLTTQISGPVSGVPYEILTYGGWI